MRNEEPIEVALHDGINALRKMREIAHVDNPRGLTPQQRRLAREMARYAAERARSWALETELIAYHFEQSLTPCNEDGSDL